MGEGRCIIGGGGGGYEERRVMFVEDKEGVEKEGNKERDFGEGGRNIRREKCVTQKLTFLFKNDEIFNLDYLTVSGCLTPRYITSICSI